MKHGTGHRAIKPNFKTLLIYVHIQHICGSNISSEDTVKAVLLYHSEYLLVFCLLVPFYDNFNMRWPSGTARLVRSVERSEHEATLDFSILGI